MSDLMTATVGANPPASDIDPNDLLAQQQNIGRLTAMAQQLRGMANPQQAAGGQMISGHYVPNYAGMGQQFVGNMYQPSAETQLTNAQTGLMRNEITNAQQQTQNIPQRFAATTVDAQGQPVEPPQAQSFPQYKAQLATAASGMLTNPLTRDAGVAMLTKLQTGGYDADEQARLDKIADQQRDLASKELIAKGANVTELGKANIQAGSAMNVAQVETMGKLLTEGIMNPKVQQQLVGQISDNVDKLGGEYGKQVDAGNTFNNQVQDMQQHGLNPSNTGALIDSFQRMINPGASVKDSQVNRIQQMVPGLDNLALQVQAVKDGKMVLTPALVQQMQHTASVFNQDAKQNLYSVTNRAASQAQQLGLNPADVVPQETHRDPSRQELYTYKPYTQMMPWLSQGQGYNQPQNGQPAQPSTPANHPAGEPGMSIVTPGGSPMPTSYKDPNWTKIEAAVAPASAQMLQNIREKGEQSDSDQVNAQSGARTPYQITAQTRQGIVKKYGYDPWASPENAVKGAAQVWQDSLQRAHGDQTLALRYYHGEDLAHPTNYPQSVLGQTKQAQQVAAARSSSLPATTSQAAGVQNFDDFLKSQ
jgi:hypothetical protein